MINLEANALKLTITSKHLIASLENSKMLWYLAIVPDENAMIYDKNKQDNKLITNLQDQIERTFEVENGPAKWVYYTKNFKKLILGS